jgi:hypothetical protein
MRTSLVYRILKKLFLVKEIRSSTGKLHFRRFRLLSTPFGSIYVHHILQSDTDKYMHDHPWSFVSFILEGAYTEECSYPPYDAFVSTSYVNQYYSGDLVFHRASDSHKITLISDQVWSLVFVSKPFRQWGYSTPRGWLNNEEYRKYKHEV